MSDSFAPYGADGDHIDCFIGPHPDSELVFVVDQETPSGKFDEHKALIGFTNIREAREGYLSNYPSGWKCGPITAMTVPQFKEWLRIGDTTKRLAPQVTKKYSMKASKCPCCGGEQGECACEVITPEWLGALESELNQLAGA